MSPEIGEGLHRLKRGGTCGTCDLQGSRGFLQIQPWRAEEVQILGLAVSKVEPRQGCPAGQNKALLARKERLQQGDLQWRQPARRG